MGTIVSEIEPESLQTSARPLPAGELRRIALAELHESPWNPRNYYPEATMDELAASMRESGFWEWNPLMARPRAEGGYEIGAGHRRYRAALLAGLETVPVVVREMSDEQFLDILNFDNSGREDVHPLHEAAGWQYWMERTGHGVIDIARRIGQSKEYVYQRLKYGALTDAAKEAFLDGGISAGQAILMARLQPDGQAKALKYCEPPPYAPDRRVSVRELAEFIQRDIHLDMERACFDLDDAGLVAAAGACTVCGKRTANAPELAGLEGEGADQCTDPACFEGKVKAHLVQVKARLAADLPGGEEVLGVSMNYQRDKSGLLGHQSWAEVKAGDAGARLAVVAGGYGVGRVLHVKLLEQGTDGKEAKAAAERESAAAKARTAAELAVRRKIMAAVRPKIGGVTRADLEALLADAVENSDGAEVLCEWHGVKAEKYDAGRALAKALPKLKDAEIFQLAVEAGVANEFTEWAAARPAVKLGELAKRYGVDADKIRRECATGTPAAGDVKKAKVQGKKLTMPAAARKRIATAQKKRWAERLKKPAPKRKA